MVFYKGLVGRIEVWEYKDRFWGVLLRHLALLPILHPPPPPTSKTQVRWLGPLLGPISSLCVQTASFLLHRRDWDQQYINMRLLEGDLGGVHFVKGDKINQHRKSTKFSSTKTLDIILLANIVIFQKELFNYCTFLRLNLFFLLAPVFVIVFRDSSYCLCVCLHIKCVFVLWESCYCYSLPYCNVVQQMQGIY